ncbi:RNaseH [Pseudomonas phage MiCath]|uniref:RNaseH n=1 Tax=Pseudomonas phage MiCath TaxID=3003729 RepID=A0AAE9VGL2_9CAUD|nr:RNaseH [Pseudomonas phage MiCath]WAX22399.1 RNaseH [Pseudomonas phage MiCath]
MLVTIICDASWCPDTGAGGYGYWIASGRGKRGGGGRLRNPTVGSNVAEMYAACNSLFIAWRVGLVVTGDEVLIQTDSMATIQAFLGLRVNLLPQEEEACNQLRNLTKQIGITVRWRHVKGHTSTRDARSATNRMCDKRAKEYMKMMRSQIHREFQHA